jgi:hypothetical protein
MRLKIDNNDELNDAMFSAASPAAPDHWSQLDRILIAVDRTLIAEVGRRCHHSLNSHRLLQCCAKEALLPSIRIVPT